MTDEIPIDRWSAALITAQSAFAEILLESLVTKGVFTRKEAVAVLMVTAEHVRLPGEGLRIEPQAYGLAQMFVQLAGKIMSDPSRG